MRVVLTMPVSVPLALVRELRTSTGASMKDCKQALVASQCDLALAKKIIAGEVAASSPQGQPSQSSAAPVPVEQHLSARSDLSGGMSLTPSPQPPLPPPPPPQPPSSTGFDDIFGVPPSGMMSSSLSMAAAPVTPPALPTTAMTAGGGDMFAGLSVGGGGGVTGAVVTLMEMGFTQADAQKALTANGDDVQRAAAALIDGGAPMASLSATVPARSPAPEPAPAPPPTPTTKLMPGGTAPKTMLMPGGTAAPDMMMMELRGSSGNSNSTPPTGAAAAAPVAAAGDLFGGMSVAAPCIPTQPTSVGGTSGLMTSRLPPPQPQPASPIANLAGGGESSAGAASAFDFMTGGRGSGAGGGASGGDGSGCADPGGGMFAGLGVVGISDGGVSGLDSSSNNSVDGAGNGPGEGGGLFSGLGIVGDGVDMSNRNEQARAEPEPEPEQTYEDEETQAFLSSLGPGESERARELLAQARAAARAAVESAAGEATTAKREAEKAVRMADGAREEAKAASAAEGAAEAAVTKAQDALTAAQQALSQAVAAAQQRQGELLEAEMTRDRLASAHRDAESSLAERRAELSRATLGAIGRVRRELQQQKLRKLELEQARLAEERRAAEAALGIHNERTQPQITAAAAAASSHGAAVAGGTGANGMHPIADDSTEALHALLRRHALDKLIPVLVENDIDSLSAVRLLSDADFKELGVSVGLRRKLFDAMSGGARGSGVGIQLTVQPTFGGGGDVVGGGGGVGGSDVGIGAMSDVTSPSSCHPPSTRLSDAAGSVMSGPALAGMFSGLGFSGTGAESTKQSAGANDSGGSSCADALPAPVGLAGMSALDFGGGASLMAGNAMRDQQGSGSSPAFGFMGGAPVGATPSPSVVGDDADANSGPNGAAPHGEMVMGQSDGSAPGGSAGSASRNGAGGMMDNIMNGTADERAQLAQMQQQYAAMQKQMEAMGIGISPQMQMPQQNVHGNGTSSSFAFM